MFSHDLDRIINNSPELKHDIYCYRGTSDYININNGYDISSSLINPNSQYKFNDQTSFSLSFTVAKYFTDILPEDKRCIYRTTIMKGSKALYIAPLAKFENELEILMPSNSVALTNDKNIEYNYNNAKNKYDICSINKFRSIDIITKNIDLEELREVIEPREEVVTITDNHDKFSIVTANIDALTESSDKIDNLISKLIQNNPKIVCIQESNTDINSIMKKSGYSLIANNDNGKFDLIEIYIKNGSDIEYISDSKIETKYCPTKRKDIILNFKYKEKIIKIGVVHICGGGPDERIINSDSFDVIINDDDINNDDDYIKKNLKL